MAAALSDGASWGPPHIAQVLTSASPPFLITGVNNAWVQLCGYTSAEAIGQTCKFLQCPETANETREALQQLHQAISEGRGVTVRLLNRKKSGERFLNELTLHVLHDPEGNPKGFRGHLVPVDMNELNSRGTSGDSVPFAPGAAAPPPLGELRTESAWPPNVQIPQQAGKAAAGKGGERGEGASGGGEAYGASSVAGSELLSRDAFPLQTLHSHPVSPVLLRLLQLNNMSSMDGRAMLSQLTSACGAGGAGLAGGAAPAWPTAHPQLPLGAMSAATVSHAQSSHAAAALQHAAVTQAAQQAFADALVSAHACPAGSWMVHPQHAAAHSAHLQAYPPSALQQSWNTAAVGYGVPPSLLSAAAAHGLWGSLPPHPHAALAQSSASYQHHQRSLGATAHAAAAHAAAAALLQPPPQLPSPQQPPLASMYSSHDRANQGNEVKLTPRLPPFPQHLAALPHLFARGRAPLHRLPEGPVSSPASTPPSRDHAAPSASAPLSCSHAPPARPSRPLFPLAPPPPTPRLPLPRVQAFLAAVAGQGVLPNTSFDAAFAEAPPLPRPATSSAAASEGDATGRSYGHVRDGARDDASTADQSNGQSGSPAGGAGGRATASSRKRSCQTAQAGNWNPASQQPSLGADGRPMPSHEGSTRTGGGPLRVSSETAAKALGLSRSPPPGLRGSPSELRGSPLGVASGLGLGADDRGGFWAGMIRLGEGGWHSPSSASPTNVDGKIVKPLASRAAAGSGAGGSGGRSGLPSLPSNASFHRALSSALMSSEDAQAAHEEVMQLEGFLDMLENWDEFERDREQQRTPDREEASESGARGGEDGR